MFSSFICFFKISEINLGERSLFIYLFIYFGSWWILSNGIQHVYISSAWDSFPLSFIIVFVLLILVFSSEILFLSLLFILYFSSSIFSFILTLIVFLSAPLNSEKTSQVTPVIHWLELLYFIIPALYHCHYEYAIVLVSCNLSLSYWSFSSHYSAVSFACFLSNGGLALYPFEFHLFFNSLGKICLEVPFTAQSSRFHPLSIVWLHCLIALWYLLSFLFEWGNIYADSESARWQC